MKLNSINIDVHKGLGFNVHKQLVNLAVGIKSNEYRTQCYNNKTLNQMVKPQLHD